MEQFTAHFEALSRKDIYFIFKARCDVFVVEQACAYPEVDEIDIEETTLHLGYKSACGEVVAYARVYQNKKMHSAIGRVLVTKQARGQGLATKVMVDALGLCKSTWPEAPIYISAQCYLEAFYEGLGFVTQGDPYLEDGIPHQDMMFVEDRAK